MTTPLLVLNVGMTANDNTGDPLRTAAQKIVASFNLIGVLSDLGAPTVTADISGLAASARTDTTNASNISSGILPIARLPATTLYTVTGITIAAPGVVTVTGINPSEGAIVFFQTTGGGVLPGILSGGTQYYVRNPSTNTFQIALSSGGTAITTTGTFTGPVTAQFAFTIGHSIALVDVANTYSALQKFGQVYFENLTFAPPAAPGVAGSAGVGTGAMYIKTNRTGGSAQYGNVLVNGLNTAVIAAPNFDVGLTSWNTATNMTGGSVQGGWFAALSPSFTGTFTNGSYIGMTINAGNRFGYLGILTDLTGGVPYGIGLQVGADIGPSQDAQAFYTVTNITIAAPGVVSIASVTCLEGMSVFFQTGVGGTLPGGLAASTKYICRNPAAGTFQVATTIGGTPITTTGSFAGPVTALLQWPTPWGISVNAGSKGNQFGVGYFLAKSAIQVGGYGHYEWGGPAAIGQPFGWALVNGFWQQGLDLSNATFSTGIAVKVGTGDSIYYGGARITAPAAATNGITITTGNTTDYGSLFGNNSGQIVLKWRSTGVAELGFYGATPVVQPAAYGTPTSVTKTLNLPGTTATLAQVGGTLAALIADLKSEGIIGA